MVQSGLRRLHESSERKMKYLVAVLLWVASNMAYAGGCNELYNHQFNTLQGEKINLCDYQDKPILVVNTASKCGFTPQFEKLESMYKHYKSRGLLIIGFPSNDFKQELSSNKEIGDFCKQTYAVQFPMVGKTSVVGPQAHLFYKQLAAITKEPPMWNFYKYLILPNGEQVYAYSSDVEPEASQIMTKLKPYLK
ncbi:glutathione peroxidase [Methylovorus sp. MP688]|nr:glutathione peroxidase [Methylovorus sp. MP688]